MVFRFSPALAVSVAILIVLLPREAPWSVPLLVLARFAGGFPVRRTLFGESWDFVAYVAVLVPLFIVDLATFEPAMPPPANE